MRILIYDNDMQNLEKFCNMISLYPIEIIVDKASNYNDMINFFFNYTYENIFIDYDDIGKKITQKIITKKPSQKIYLFTNNNECFLEKDCEVCSLKYKKNIIIKPLSQEQLTKILSRKFICETKDLKDKEFIIEKIKKYVNYKYPYLKFDFCKDSSSYISDYIPIYTLVFATDLLNSHGIKFKVPNPNQILIE